MRSFIDLVPVRLVVMVPAHLVVLVLAHLGCHGTGLPGCPGKQIKIKCVCHVFLFHGEHFESTCVTFFVDVLLSNQVHCTPSLTLSSEKNNSILEPRLGETYLNLSAVSRLTI